uniref:Uncharacterized protein n=1 Tax=Malurus cyaneus samueli TaxID=2593467 RepID=A0A8C5UGR5_9PASS
MWQNISGSRLRISIKCSLNTPRLQQEYKWRNLNFYSPTTGTCQMSPFSSPVVSEDVNNWNCFTFLHRFLELQSQVRSSLYWEWDLTMTLMIVFQALEGSRELENLLGVSHSSCVLSAELQKTQELGEEKNPLLINKLFNKEPFITLNKDPSSCSLSKRLHLDCWAFLLLLEEVGLFVCLAAGLG